MVGNKNRLYVALYTSGVGDNEEQKLVWSPHNCIFVLMNII